MSQHFRGWGLLRILAEYDRAVREGRIEVRRTPPREDDNTVERLVMHVDAGGPDMTAVTAVRGNQIIGVILDDPYAEEHTYEGEYHVVPPREAMSTILRNYQEPKTLPRAQAPVTHKGPQPRTKYPRRR